MGALVTRLWCTVLGGLGAKEPSSCPHCPDREGHHWIRWGTYSRYAEGGSGRITVQRYCCLFTRRTFSLLPDGLLPYHYRRTATILRLLWALFVAGVAPSTISRSGRGSPRTSLRCLAKSFLGTVCHLRLLGQQGVLAPKPFLIRLLGLEPGAIADQFRAWKEREPKHSIVGIYPR